MPSTGQRAHMADGQGGVSPVLFHFAAREMGAEAVVGFGEEGGFHEAGFFFDGGKRHGVAGFGAYLFDGDPPAGRARMDGGPGGGVGRNVVLEIEQEWRIGA
jgi:hypothetical protein